MIRLTYIGFTHRTAPLSVRERITPPTDALDAYAHLVRAGAKESAVLRTCGRFETLLVTDGGTTSPSSAVASILTYLSTRSGLSIPALRRHAMMLHGDAVVAHLFRVAAGLDSPILGEDHVLGQVGACLADAQRRGTTGPILSALLRSAIRAGRRARNESHLRQVASSFSEQAVRVLRDRAASGPPGSLIVIGSGTMAVETVCGVRDAGWSRIVIAGRHPSRTGELAARVGGRAIGLDEMARELAEADVIVACLSSATPLLTVSMLQEALSRRARPPLRNILLLIDLGMPRNIEADVARLPGVELLDLEGLARRHGRHAGDLLETVKAEAERILEEEQARFFRWCVERERRLRGEPSSPALLAGGGAETRRASRSTTDAPRGRVAV